MRLTLQHKANGAILITFVLIAVIFGAIQLPFQQRRMESAQQRIEILLKSLVERDQEPLANEIFEDRAHAIQIRLAQMMRVNGILAISVYDKRGRLLAMEGTQTPRTDLPIDRQKMSAREALISQTELFGQRTLVYLQRIEAIGEGIGFIQISYSLAEIQRERRQAFLIFGGLLVSILVIMLVLLNYILARVIIKPITSLRDSMQGMHRGTLGEQVPIGSRDEIGDLTQAFNRMSADLAFSYRQIEDQYGELKASEKRLSDERERLDVTLRSIGDGVIATDVTGQVTLLNPSAAVLIGYEMDEALGKPLDRVFQVTNAETGQAMESPIGYVLKTGQLLSLTEHCVLIAKDGMRRAISYNSTPIVDNERRIIGIILVFQDITEKRRIEDEMTQMRLNLKNIIDSMPSLLISVNADGVVREWNQAAARITGIPSTHAIGRELWEVMPILEKYKAYLHEIIQTRLPREFHREVLQHGETESYHNVALFPLIANCVQGVVIRVDDITELEHKEQQLRQAQKMETIGTLAGGLAHDFNNVLGGITGALSLIKFKLQQDKQIDREFILKYLNIMEESGKRAADMVKQLLSISRKQEMDLEPVELNATIANVMAICTNSFDKCIELETQFAEEQAIVKGSMTQVEQVLLNLCVNAAHAMTTMRREDEPQGGRLSVALRKIFADRKFCATHPEATEGAYWVLTVHDTGVGMDTKTVAKIFDPFFTTKQKDKGTGLGLAMAYNIVQQHGGFIDVYSEVGLGSTFNVFLPALHGAGVEQAVATDMVVSRGEGLILVVDDEEMIRQTAQAILEECGYKVILANNGDEGVRLFQERHREIKAVLLDMVMPKKSGKEAYLEMKKIDPHLKVLLASGFKQDERVEAVLDLGVQGFVQKPYSIEILSRAIFNVLNT